MKYTINLTDPNSHLITVDLIFSAPWDNPVLELPSWTPGSYLIREYAKNLQDLEILLPTSSHLLISKIAKNRWKLVVKKDTKVRIQYKIYAFELTVRTSYFDDRKVLISPASIFFYLTDERQNRHNKSDQFFVSFLLLKDWEIISSLDKKETSFIANNFDELVDSPFGGGIPSVIDKFQYNINDGIKTIDNLFVIIGDPGNQNIESVATDLQKIQIETIRIFGELPYTKYRWVLYVVDKGGGGLEHKNSNFSIISRWSFIQRKSYIKLLGLEAHEHFHSFNIKRIRPKQLGPFDYDKEVYTTLLWIAEGFTSFYDNVILPRAKLISIEEYWKLIADDLKALFNVPGRFVKSLAESSFDAWIKLYRPDENSVNSTVSYYLKGGFIGLIFDLEIRRQTNFKKSLDDFYQYMYKLYKEDPEKGFDEESTLCLLEKSTKTNLQIFWDKFILGTEPIEDTLRNLIQQLGYTIETENAKIPYIGWKLSNKSNEVKLVLSDSPAMVGGIFSRDIIVAINGYQMGSTLIKRMFDDHIFEKELQIHLFRDGKLLQRKIKVNKPEIESINIVELEKLSEQQLRNRNMFFIEN